MPRYNYAIAVGFDQLDADLTNFEDIFGQPPRGTRVSVGSQITALLDGSSVIDGDRVIRLTFTAAPFAGLQSYMNTVFGGFDATASVKCTLKTRKADNTFALFNVHAIPPRDEEDYTHVQTNFVRDLVLSFRVD